MKADLSPTGRALRALELLQAQPGITAGQLAAQLDVTERAARRYVAILREAGIPVESTRGPYGGYRVGRGIRLPPLVFTAAEALGLVMAVLDGSHAAADADDPVGAALGKIIRALPENVGRQAATMRRHASAAPDRGAVRPGTETTSALVDAIAAQRRVSIGYRTQSGRQWAEDVDPWAVVVRHGRWYLLCHSHRANAARAYRVDRIQSVAGGGGQLPKLTLVKLKFTVAFMKRYGQACAIARALDVVGERWSLLLVRELTFGPRRYRDLATGLPGIPSNVLAGRLKDLQAAGVVTRRTLPAPTDVTVYELTDAGRALQPALNDLLDWGLRYGPEPSRDDVVQPGWALLGATGRPAALPDGRTCELRVGPEFFYLSSDAGKLTVRRGPAPDGDAVVTMSAGTLYSLVTGQTTVTDAVRHSAVDGDTEIARRALEPLAATRTRPAPAI